MTAPVGTAPFTTEESKTSENFHNRVISEVFSEYKKHDPNWEIRFRITLEELYNRPCKYALSVNTRKSLVFEADGGWIFYKGKVIGVGENKYQSNSTNAIERAHRYRGLVPDQNLFISINAPVRSAVAKVIETLDFFGVFVVVNVTDELEFREKVIEWFEVMKASIND